MEPTKQILVTGAKGFIGKNLILALKNKGFSNIVGFDVDSSREDLAACAKTCDFVFHLAGVNRPQNDSEFMAGNHGFTHDLLFLLREQGNKAPVLITSSIQAALDNAYGQSKLAGEQVVFDHGVLNDSAVYVFRLPNVFGKWCRPNYNSAVATFCHNVANGLEIQVNSADYVMTLVYIDDVVQAFIKSLTGDVLCEDGFCMIPTVHKVKLGEISDLILGFKKSRETLAVPKLDNGFEKALYSTYLSYLPVDAFSYPLKMNVDNRGSFTEIIRTPDRGQFSVNKSNPGITKGNHWHHTKNEKFVVVSGEALIQFRQVDSDVVIDYRVSGNAIEVVDIPVGYTHNIINVGETELVTFMWCNEAFDAERPDTYFLEV